MVGILKCTTTDARNETVQLGQRTCPEGQGSGEALFLCQPRNILRIIKTCVFLSHSPKTSKTLPSRLHVNRKIKCTLVQTLRDCKGRTAHRGSRGIVQLFLNHGTRRR